jgi:pimeloyl-ACP methyl ester carboxylesterase
VTTRPGVAQGDNGWARIFVPGFAARARAYEEGLPPGWSALQPPPPSRSDGRVGRLADWLMVEATRGPGPPLLAGHSMGAALAVLTAARAPERVSGLVLVAPAGLPLEKPLRANVTALARQLASGTYRAGDTAASAAELVTAPRSSARLIRSLRRLDLRAEMRAVRGHRIPTVVIGCATDTLTPPWYCRATAELLGAAYREVPLEGGHVWMFGRWPAFAEALAEAASLVERGRDPAD